MKINRSILLFIFSSILSSVSAQAQSPTGGIEATSDLNQNYKINLDTRKIKPKDSSNTADNVTCYYQNGYIHILFNKSEGKAKLSILNLNTHECQTCSFPTFSPFSIYMGTTSSSYEIKIETTQDTYVGYITLY